MQPGRLLVGILTIIVGATFTAQGLGFLRGSSFMVGDVRWAIIGPAVVIVGAAVALSGRRRVRGR
jgi:hypothetical protein